MSIPTGTSASGKRLTVPVVTPTGGEITGVGTTDYNFGFGNEEIINPYEI